MNDENQPPLNPIPLPPGFSLEAHRPPVQQSSGAKARRRPRKPTGAEPDAGCPVLTKWERIKAKFAEKIAQIEPETLRSVLLACGIAAGLVAAILLLVKMVPVGICLLALLGVGLLIAIWDRIRYFPRPF